MTTNSPNPVYGDMQALIVEKDTETGMLSIKTPCGAITYQPETGVLKTAKGFLPTINQWGYYALYFFRKTVRAHRLAWFMYYGKWAEHEIDHIDGNPLNNRINNLRECTRGENEYNKSLIASNRSGVKGVYWNKKCSRWHARVRHNGKRLNLGVYKDIEDAKEAVIAARTRLHNQFANHGVEVKND